MALYVNGNKVSGGGGGSNSVELTYAEYQALTPEQQLDGTEYFITDINGDGQDFQPICYSEEEREIGVWIDGKPLYQLTCVGEAVTEGQSGAIDLTDYSIDTFVGVDSGASMFIRADGGQGYTINGNELQDSQWGITVYGNQSNVVVNTRRFGLTSWFATIRYTKTTDQAGSGTWTPQGVPAHHYSIDEQVVGTWVDGKTLYEKTTTYNITTSLSDWTVFDDTVSYDTLVSAQGTVAFSQTEQQVISSSPTADPRFEVKSDHKLYYYGSPTRSGYMTFQYTKSST